MEDLELQLPFSERVIQPIIKGILGTVSKVSPSKNADKVKHNLEMAGNPNGLTASTFVGMRVTLFALLGVAMLVITSVVNDVTPIQRLLAPVLGGAIGYVAPGIWLDRKIGRANIIFCARCPMRSTC